MGSDPVELMRVRLTNMSDRPITLTPTAAIPIYGRSADNLRDHRHVTSLLHRVRCILTACWSALPCPLTSAAMTPTAVTYAVLGANGDGAAPVGFFPVVEDFIGEGGTLEWPKRW